LIFIRVQASDRPDRRRIGLVGGGMRRVVIVDEVEESSTFGLKDTEREEGRADQVRKFEMVSERTSIR
jgi:hypothetical protein